MKTIKNILKLTGLGVLAAILSIGLFSACFSAFDTPVAGTEGISAGKGAVQINIGDSAARTAFPAMAGVTYDVTLTGGGETITETFTRANGSVELFPGTWALTVEAKNASTVIASATLPGITVTAGKSTEVSVRLEAAGTANGTFAWSADFPNSLDTAVLAYSGAATGNVDINVASSSSDITVAGTKRSGTLELAPGVYLVTINLAKGSKTAGDALAVHIYSGLTTTKNDWVFTADSLIESKALAISIDIIPSPGVTVNSAELTLSGDGGMVHQDHLLTNSGGNTWTLSTTVPDTTTTLGWELAIVTAGGTHTAQGTGVAYSASLTLTAVNIYTLTATVGPNGTLSVNGTPYDSVREFLDGASVTLTANAIGGYELDSLTVNDVPNSPHTFTISGDTTVNVTFKEVVGVDPNLIFEWTTANGEPAVSGVPSMTWSTGANAAATVSTAKLTGSGKYTEVPISLASGGNNTTSIAYNNGISFAADSTNARILVIGAGIGKSVTTAGPTHQAGGFNFLNGFPAGKTKIQVTITLGSFTGGSGNFSVTLNNNTTNGASCPLTPTQGGGARIIYHAAPNGTSFTHAQNGNWNGSTTYTSRAFSPDDFTGGSATLETAFIGIAHTSGDNAFTITGIKIEYVD